MSDVAAQLLEFPPEISSERQLTPEEYNTKIDIFLKITLVNISANKLAAADKNQDLLQIIDPTINSLAYLFVLRNRLFEPSGKSKQNISPNTLTLALEFLTKFDGVQMRYAGSDFRTLLEWLLQTANRTNMVPVILAAVRTAIFRLDPSAGTMTSTHLHFVRFCLQRRVLVEAVPLMEATIHSFPAAKSSSIDGTFPCLPHTDSTGYISLESGLTAKLSIADVQEYFLLSATIWIGLRRWDDALLNLELVLTSPTQGSPSGLMLEAYQKWIIVGCLIKGRAIDAPKTIAGSVLRCLKTCSKAYEAVAEAFAASNLLKLQAEIAIASQEFSDDGNAGLAQQLLQYLPRFQLAAFQKTYSALPLSMVANWLGQTSDNAHAFIEAVIAEGGLNATIELRDGASQEPVLRFFPDRASGPLAKSEKEYNAELINQASRTNAMVGFVKMADRRLVLTKDYVDGLRKRLRNKDDDVGSMSMMDGGDPSWDASGYQDEDLMDA
ncbi:cop9 subunit 3 [Venturia nashicola]|uniref:Cop9 subunit 3 n=1 Tax=Venturia nashicola TaxID=86259 RepID=A0A4Z1P416_9PEZI|nr:cop9 subunit 3 [Venturia nashicola]TLD35195.1 cop9 subunit 3 [Venturia nashicola]